MQVSHETNGRSDYFHGNGGNRVKNLTIFLTACALLLLPTTAWADYYAVFTHPNDAKSLVGEAYRRFTYAFTLTGKPTLKVRLMKTGGGFVTGISPWPSLKLVTNDSVSQSAYLQPDSFGVYSFPLDTTTFPDGSLAIGVQVDPAWGGTAIRPLMLNVTIDNAPGPVTGAQTLWYCTPQFNMFWRNWKGGCDSIEWNGQPVTINSLPGKVRTATPYTTRLGSTDLWTQRVGTNTSGMFPRIFETKAGHFGIWFKQQYYRSSLDDHRTIIEMDGCRNEGTIGFMVKAIPASDGGIFGVTTQGRIFHSGPRGCVHTVAGWRLKKDVIPPYWEDNKDPQFDDRWENVGKFEEDGPQSLFEPWGIASNPAKPWELYVADTRNHRIVEMAYGELAPVPTSEATDVEHFSGSRTKTAGYKDGTAEETLFNEPWDLVSLPDGSYLVTDMWNHAIRRIAPDGSSTTVAQSRVLPTRAQLSLTDRISGPSKLPSELRPTYSAAGPCTGPTKAIFAAPAGIARTSDPNVVNFVTYGTYVIYKLTLSPCRIDVLAPMVGVTGRDYEPTIHVDAAGANGPVDDIFLGSWGQSSNQRYDKNGKPVGKWMPSGPNQVANEGHQQYVQNPGYPWMAFPDPNGRMWVAGSVGEVYILTKKLGTDPTFNLTTFNSGMQVWGTGTTTGAGAVRRPSFGLACGERGQNAFGGPGWDSLKAMSASDFRTWTKAGGCGSIARSEITDADADNMKYVIDWEAALGQDPVPVPSVDSPIYNGAMVITGTGGTPGARITVLVNSIEVELSEDAIVEEAGTWSAQLVAEVVTNDTVAASQAFGGFESAASSAVTVVADTVPTTPGQPSQAGGTCTITVTWAGSNDNIGVVTYQILRGGVAVGSVNAPTTSFKHEGIASGTNDTYTVIAYDTAGQASATSAASAQVYCVIN